MKMHKLLIHVTPLIKARLENLRAQGTTASGYIRALLEGEFSQDRKPKHRVTGNYVHRSRARAAIRGHPGYCVEAESRLFTILFIFSLSPFT